MASHIHRTHRSGWLRAGVLGANDGLLSISSLLLGVVAARMDVNGILLAGLAGLIGGALSMAAGEYVSVSSQADTERADLELERSSLLNDYDSEHAELRDIYIQRGVDPDLAKQVSTQLMAHDALGAHARDEIGITDVLTARPLQAAFASAISFLLGGIIPIITALCIPQSLFIPSIALVSIFTLSLLGAIAAKVGGASILRGALRMLIWGSLVMGFTMAAGALLGVVV